MKKIIIATSIVILLAFGFLFGRIATPREEGGEPREPTMSTISIPVIEIGGARLKETEGENEEIIARAKERGEYIGCGDSLFYYEKEIPLVGALLAATYEHLFRLENPVLVGGKSYSNPISPQAKRRTVQRAEETFIYDPLGFERVEASGPKAKVYLSGDYVPDGKCDIYRIKAVLEFAAKQFPEISEVEIYINGERENFAD